MKRLNGISVLFNLVIALLLGFAIGSVFQSVAAAATTTGVLFASGFFVKSIPGLINMAIQTEVWVQDIEDVLFEQSEFLQFSVDHGAFVNDKTVHIPNSGANPNIEKNRSILPAIISQRTDTDVEYILNEFTTDPILVTNLDEIQTSYAKRQSVLSQHMSTLSERIGTEGLFDWSPSATADAARIVRTSGANGTSLAPGATGTRKKVLKEDIAKLAAVLDKDKFGGEGRYLEMPVDMYYELFEVDALVRRDFMDRTAIPNAVINTLFRFSIMVRPTVTVFDNTADPVKKAIGAATAATDHLSCLAWSSKAVARARGEIKLFSKEQDPTLFGDVFSALVMFATSPLRTNKEGIAVLVQATGV